jgi:hypothetical protein
MNNKIKKMTFYVAIVLVFGYSSCFSKMTTAQIIIDHPTTYKGMTVDLTNQSFLITNNATLTIENCSIKGVISPASPILFNLSSGQIIFKNNLVSIVAKDIAPNPTSVSVYYVFKIDQGSMTLSGNEFSVDKPYSIGGLTTGDTYTKDFIITDNTFYKFHGGLFFHNTQNLLIQKNSFVQVSGSNIYINTDIDSTIQDNIILFSGNNNVGDAIDITDSTNTDIINNFIGNGSCYSILILNCENLNIINNKIMGGITYAISINSSLSLKSNNEKYLLLLSGRFKPSNNTNLSNSNINIANNYISQNRYGLTVKHAVGLKVNDNFFIQHFSNASDRQFWTNNDILITDTSGISWQNNLYKEAYSQVDNDDNALAKQFVIFPEHGGVILQ